jgi:hypothetical protein
MRGRVRDPRTANGATAECPPSGRDNSSVPAINALLLGSLLYRSRLVPRTIPLLGLIGAPLLISAVIATLFGGIDQNSSLAALAALPVAAWELSLGVWLVVKGFKPPSPVIAGVA